MDPMPDGRSEPSLYLKQAVSSLSGSKPGGPGTGMTHSIETVDNDRAIAMTAVGVIR
jgi:hypothetical protein